MSWEQLGEKFAALAEGVYTPAEQDAIVDAVRSLDEIDARDLVELLTA
jgi:hypothetical protein